MNELQKQEINFFSKKKVKKDPNKKSNLFFNVTMTLIILFVLSLYLYIMELAEGRGIVTYMLFTNEKVEFIKRYQNEGVVDKFYGLLQKYSNEDVVNNFKALLQAHRISLRSKINMLDFDDLAILTEELIVDKNISIKNKKEITKEFLSHLDDPDNDGHRICEKSIKNKIVCIILPSDARDFVQHKNKIKEKILSLKIE